MATKKAEEIPDEPASDGAIAVNDAWTGLLAISLLALVIGSGFLLWDYLQYDEKPPIVPKYAPTAPQPPKEGEKKDDKGKDKEKAHRWNSLDSTLQFADHGPTLQSRPAAALPWRANRVC